MKTFQEEFLCHYGVPGMKWGVRKQEYRENRANAKASYKAAKQKLKAARKMKKGYVGIKGAAKVRARNKAINKASMNVLNKKAAYNASKKRSDKAAAKAEFNTYRKAMQISGIRNSAADARYGGQSTKIYDNVRTQKGKAYADKVEKSVQNHAIAGIVGSTAVFAGSVALQALLNRKRF